MCNCAKQRTASSGSLEQRSAPLCFYRWLLFLCALLETKTYQLEWVFLIFFSYVKCCGRSHFTWEKQRMHDTELAWIICKLEWKDQARYYWKLLDFPRNIETKLWKNSLNQRERVGRYLYVWKHCLDFSDFYFRVKVLWNVVFIGCLKSMPISHGM